ncbi:hypothetical protein HispidOSU_029190 [Sigmodon hispidus]
MRGRKTKQRGPEKVLIAAAQIPSLESQGEEQADHKTICCADLPILRKPRLQAKPGRCD